MNNNKYDIISIFDSEAYNKYEMIPNPYKNRICIDGVSIKSKCPVCEANIENAANITLEKEKEPYITNYVCHTCEAVIYQSAEYVIELHKLLKECIQIVKENRKQNETI